MPIAAVGDGRAVFRELQRAEQALCLTDGGLNRFTGVDITSVALLIKLVTRHHADIFRQLDAGGFTEAEQLGVLRHQTDLQIVTHGIEIDVA